MGGKQLLTDIDASLQSLGIEDGAKLILLEKPAKVEGVLVSGHADEKYNGEYIKQEGLINGASYFINKNCSVTLYFYNCGSGRPGWHFDHRDILEVQGKQNWYDIGWLEQRQASEYPPEGTHDFYREGAEALTLKIIN